MSLTSLTPLIERFFLVLSDESPSTQDSRAPRSTERGIARRTVLAGAAREQGVGRRTVLIGTAWAVPAIALTAATPAFASASGTTLAFSRPTYRGATCSAVTGATVTASDGGSPQAGVSVTATLSGGYEFSTGGTTFTSQTGSNGSMTLPDITVPASGGAATLSATTSGAPSTSAALVSVAASVAVYLQNGVKYTPTGVPSGSTPVGGSLYLTPNADLVDAANGGQVVSSNVAACGDIASTSTDWGVPVLKADGTCTYVYDGTEMATINVPHGSTPSIGSSFITSDGREIVGGSGTTRITDVAGHGTYYNDGADSLTPFSKRDGTFVYLQGSTVYPAVGVPAGSTPACGRFFLTPTGSLVDGADGSTVATDIDAYGMLSTDSSTWLLTARKTNGVAVIVRPGSETPALGVPNGSQPIGAGVFLAADGRLLDGVNAATILATGVSDPGAFAVLPGSWRIPLAAAAISASVVTDGTSQAAAGLPSGSTPVISSLYLTPSGDLADSSANWTVVSSDIVAYGQSAADSQNWSFPARKSDGTCVYIFQGREYATVGVPNGSYPTAGSSFVTTDGREIRGNDGTVRMTGVLAFGDVYYDGTDYYSPFSKQDGSSAFLTNSTETATVGVPSGSSPVAARFFRAQDGRLIDGGDGTVLATGVAHHGLIATRIGGWVIPVTMLDGSCAIVSSSSVTTTSGVPAGSAPVAAGLFRTADGRLVDGLNGGATLATSDVLVGTYRELYSTTWSLPLGIQSSGC